MAPTTLVRESSTQRSHIDAPTVSNFRKQIFTSELNEARVRTITWWWEFHIKCSKEKILLLAISGHLPFRVEHKTLRHVEEFLEMKIIKRENFQPSFQYPYVSDTELNLLGLPTSLKFHLRSVGMDWILAGARKVAPTRFEFMMEK